MITPSHIGQYRIVRKIGAGGMGLVFLGEHTLLGRRAAIKTLLPTVAASKEIVERFFNEARATSAIADPGVIQIFDFGYHVDGTAYIVMELLEGEALSARLERLGKLALGDALRFARQIAGSLAAAHARDIVHRDLKPENIFLVRDAEAKGGERTKIIDFGICKLGAGDPMLTEAGAMIGTPVYMSPEQCRGSGEVDHRSDIYGFGCLLFHLITGRPPFTGDASGDLIVAHIQEEPPRASRYVPEVPAAVDELLLQCMAKAPEDRFVSMTAVQAALGDLAVQFEDVAIAAVAAPPPTVPLGRGFRSMYDANLAAWLGGSPPGGVMTHPLRARLPGLSTPPAPPDASDAGESDELEVPPSRAWVRAVLACVLVVGVVLGLIATPLVLGGDDDRSASRVQPVALPVEHEPATAPPVVAPAAAPVESLASTERTAHAAAEPSSDSASAERTAHAAAEPSSDSASKPSSGTDRIPSTDTASTDTATAGTGSPDAANAKRAEPMISAAALAAKARPPSDPPRSAGPSRSSREPPRSSKAAPSRASADPPSRARSTAAVAASRSLQATVPSGPITSPMELPAAKSSQAAPSSAAPATPPARGATAAPASTPPAAPPPASAVQPASPSSPSPAPARPAAPPTPPTSPEDLYDTR